MDCRETDSRFFNLINHETKLHITVSKTSTLVSCKLGGHEIIVDGSLHNQSHETWAIGDRPYQKINSLPWLCHVRGAELFLSTSNGTSSIIYELTRLNELNGIVKLKSIHLQHQVTYFNLNNAKEKTSVDGHTLGVQCNGSTNRIRVQNTKLLCQCNKRSSILPQSLIGDIPFELVQHDANVSINDTENSVGTEDDIIVCDAVYSLESTCPLDFLRAQLRYCHRAIVFEVRSLQAGISSNHHSSIPTSTYRCSNNAQSNDVQSHETQQASSSSNAPDSFENCQAYESSDCVQPREKWLNSLIDASSTTSPARCTSLPSNDNQSTSAMPTSSQPSAILRIRIRVTNFGVCIMPLMMTNYSFTYSFFE